MTSNSLTWMVVSPGIGSILNKTHTPRWPICPLSSVSSHLLSHRWLPSEPKPGTKLQQNLNMKGSYHHFTSVGSFCKTQISSGVNFSLSWRRLFRKNDIWFIRWRSVLYYTYGDIFCLNHLSSYLRRVRIVCRHQIWQFLIKHTEETYTWHSTSTKR